MNHAARTHALYSASSAKGWMHCHARSRLVRAAPPSMESPWASDGTEAHEVLDFALNNDIRLALIALIESGVTWTHKADDEGVRLASIQTCLDYVYEILFQYPDAKLFTELALGFPTNLDVDAGGHVDILIYSPSSHRMWIVDFKHGAGVTVEIEEDGECNEQLVMYAIMGADELRRLHPPSAPFPWPDTTIAIVQPRRDHEEGFVRERTLTSDDLHLARDMMEWHMEQGEKPDAVTTPGSWCRWCPANATTCFESEQALLRSAATNFRSVKTITPEGLDDPNRMDIERLEAALQLKPLVDAFFKVVTERMTDWLRAGNKSSAFKLVEAQARREWSPYMTEKAIAARLQALASASLDEVYPRQLMNITDADKLVADTFKATGGYGTAKQAAEAAKRKLAELTLKDTSGNLRLVPVSDSKPAIDPTKINFGSVKLIEPST